MTVIHVRPALALSLALAAGATAQTEPTPTATPVPKPAATAKPAAGAASPEALARRLCDALHGLPAKRRQECCGSSGMSLAGMCGQELASALKRRSVTLDPKAIDQCVAQSESQLQGCGWITPLLPPLPSACTSLIRGSLAAGAACRSSLECAGGLYCRGASAENPGVCRLPAAPRAKCEIPSDNLSAFTRANDDPRHPSCQGRCVKGACVPFVAAGGKCAASTACAPGLNCIAGTCEARPLPRLGEPCGERTACDGGAVCVAGVCRAQKGAGEPCAAPFECRGLLCQKAAGAATGVCADPCGQTAAPAR